MTPQQLAAATGTNVANATAWLPAIEAACARHGITAVKHQAWFLAQIGEESGGLTVVKENLFYSTPERLCQVWPSRFPTVAAAMPFTKNPVALAEKVYGGRAELGNTSPGDGGKFLGRGLIQLTGKDWYAKYQAATGNQVLTSPELLESKALAADSAAWYWTADGCGAFVDRSDLTGLTKRINGGLTNLALRQTLTTAAMKAFGLSA